MKIGTKSVLFGAHCFFIHPWFVAYAWYKLYGFPWDPRLWVCFFVHDLGYFGKPNMDGPEGEQHVEFGAYWVSRLFDRKFEGWFDSWYWCGPETLNGYRLDYWGKMCLYHSRYYSKKHNAEPSKLCFADKLSLYYTPAWLYLPMVILTGEIEEYLENAKKADLNHWRAMYFQGQLGYNIFIKAWYAQLQQYMHDWVYEHLDGKKDEWTDEKRNQINE